MDRRYSDPCARPWNGIDSPRRSFSLRRGRNSAPNCVPFRYDARVYTHTHIRARSGLSSVQKRERERERDRCPRVIPSTEPRHFLDMRAYISRFPVRTRGNVYTARPDTGWNRIRRVIYRGNNESVDSKLDTRSDLINISPLFWKGKIRLLEGRVCSFCSKWSSLVNLGPRETCLNFHRA